MFIYIQVLLIINSHAILIEDGQISKMDIEKNHDPTG